MDFTDPSRLRNEDEKKLIIDAHKPTTLPHGDWPDDAAASVVAVAPVVDKKTKKAEDDLEPVSDVESEKNEDADISPPPAVAAGGATVTEAVLSVMQDGTENEMIIDGTQARDDVD